MSDYSDHLTTIEKAQRELAWMLPEGKFKEAKEKALLLEQAARALVEVCKREGNDPRMIYAHLNVYAGRNG